jgi:hypothetical protein
LRGKKRKQIGLVSGPTGPESVRAALGNLHNPESAESLESGAAQETMLRELEGFETEIKSADSRCNLVQWGQNLPPQSFQMAGI